MNHHTGCDCEQCLLAQMTADDPAVRQSGWAAWYRRDAPVIRAFVERRCRALGCQEQGEDLLQDSFLIGFRNVSRGAYADQTKGLRAYLYGIAKNLLCELGRIQRKIGGQQTLDEELQSIQTVTLEDRLYLDEVRRRVQEAYQRQSLLHRQVMHGLYVEGKSSDQLGKELGETASNIRAIARRAINEIGRQLAHEYGIHISSGAIRSCLQMSVCVHPGLCAPNSLCNSAALAHMK